MKYVLMTLIGWYRKYLSPLLGKHCIYTPTCSAYALEAIAVAQVDMGLIAAVVGVIVVMICLSVIMVRILVGALILTRRILGGKLVVFIRLNTKVIRMIITET